MESLCRLHNNQKRCQNFDSFSQNDRVFQESEKVADEIDNKRERNLNINSFKMGKSLEGLKAFLNIPFC